MYKEIMVVLQECLDVKTKILWYGIIIKLYKEIKIKIYVAFTLFRA